jgi:flagellar biosynthesis/type III secretory pathway M-ring protein FliF/YscJ
MTPVLIVMGIPPAVAVATQGAPIVASSTTSVLAALRRRAIDRMNRSPQKKLEQMIEFDEEQAATILKRWLMREEPA